MWCIIIGMQLRGYCLLFPNYMDRKLLIKYYMFYNFRDLKLKDYIIYWLKSKILPE